MFLEIKSLKGIESLVLNEHKNEFRLFGLDNLSLMW